MILHISIPAANPRQTAKTLGEILGGEVMQFVPGGPNCFQVYSGSHADKGTFLEVLPQQLRHAPGNGEGDPIGYERIDERTGGPQTKYYTSHVAMTSPVPEAQILAACKDAGWRTVRAWRGRVFPVWEVWVENCYLIEVILPEDVDRYTAGMCSEGFKAGFRLQEKDGIFSLDPATNHVALTEAIRQQGRAEGS